MRRRAAAATISRVFWWSAVTAAAGTTGAQAQTTVAVELGSATVSQSGLSESAVVTAGGQLRSVTPRTTLSIGALGVAGPNGSGTAQATASGSVFLQPFGPARVELSVLMTTFAATAQLPVTSLQLAARRYHQWGAGGVFYGGGGGASRWAAASLPVASAQVGGWWLRGGDQVAVVVGATLSQSEYRTQGPAGVLRTVYDVRYAESAVSWGRTVMRTELSATAGVRLGIENVDTRSLWMSGAATHPIADHLSFVLGAGRVPADFVRGVPESRFLSASLRVHSPEVRPSASRRDSTRGPMLSITREGDVHRVLVRAPGAKSVEVMGDFTDWKSVGLVGGNGSWTLDRGLSPGIHHVVIRVDGGDWIVPANLTRGHDEFGGWVGLVTVL